MGRLIDADKLKEHYAWWSGDRQADKELFDQIVDLQPTCNQLATDCVNRQSAIEAIVDKGEAGDSEVKCISCGHHIAERPFEVYCNIMCKWFNEKDYCAIFEPKERK